MTEEQTTNLPALVDGNDATPLALFGSPEERAALCQRAEAYVSRSLVMMHRARRLVLNDRVEAIGLLSARRPLLGAHFASYQRFKHVEIFDPVVQVGPSSSKLVARTMKIDCIQLGHAFREYSNRWLRLTDWEWPSYRADMLETTEALAGHLEAELRAMRQLLMISDLYGGVPASPAEVGVQI